LAALRAASKLGMAIAAIISTGTRQTAVTMFVTNPPIASDFPPYSCGERLTLFSATIEITIPTMTGTTKIPNRKKLRIPITNEATAKPFFNSGSNVTP
jgi:hypothetical protein